MKGQPGLLQEEDIQENPRLVLDMVRTVQNYAKEEYQALDGLKRDLEEGKTVSRYEISCLVDRYQGLQEEVTHQRKVRWTIDVIKRIQEAKIGNKEILDVIKSSLEDGRLLDKTEVGYVKDNWRMLQKVRQEENQLVVH